MNEQVMGAYLIQASTVMKAFTPEQQEALLGLCYHAIDELGSGFESKHAKIILDLLVEVTRSRVAANYKAKEEGE